MAVARKFEDLIIWQLASEFESWAYDISEEGAMLKDPAFRQQWRDAASSPARNIAEGFAKYDPPEFARFVNIAKGSLSELQNYMIKGKERRFFTEEEYTHGWRLLCRTIRATNRFHTYLRSCGRKGPDGKDRKEEKGKSRNGDHRKRPAEPRRT